MFQRFAVLALIVAPVGCAVAASSVPASVAQTIADVTAKPMYAHSTWGAMVIDQSTGATLLDQMGTKMFVPGSIMKTYSTAAAIKEYGPNYRFHTPVYQLGTVANGVLTGNLVLVASGDFSFGLREQSNGTLGFNSIPEIDHNYASTGFAGAAVVKGSDPLAALNELARKVHASGIHHVHGDVAIDDRLFTPYESWPDGIVSPIWINENVIDITTTRTSGGRPADVNWRPKTASIRVISKVTTAAVGAKTKPLRVQTVSPGVVQITGQIAADAKPILSTSFITDPAGFARTAFIEALRRAGVTVSATTTGPNPAKLLPSIASYGHRRTIAEHVSPPLSEFVKVILKVSYNRGADDMVCLVAVKAGSRDCVDGLARELQIITALGVNQNSTIVQDGAGSDDSSRTAPADQTTFLRNLVGQPWGHFVRDGMSVLGVDGTQATNQVGTPAAGRVRVKDGSRVAGTPAGQVYLPAKTQVGYIDAKSGRRLVYAVFVNDVPTTPDTLLDTFTTADHDVGTIVAAIQQGF